LIELLREQPNSKQISELVNRLEEAQPADLTQQFNQLSGTWELRWSSSNKPWLKQSPGLLNLQILDPEQGRGRNILKLRGPLGKLTCVQVDAEISVINQKRVNVSFKRGGWAGPNIAGRKLQLLRTIEQSFPAWLDITALDDHLRICRGNAGTTFCLLKRPDIPLPDWNL
tara:strand:- start:1371 stop:1880 length:510 start_codon:yes stop_codon:yes gene_type:complete